MNKELKSYNAATVEYDMLKGNINRMFVTKDLNECVQMYEWALKRLERIKQYNIKRLANLPELDLR